MDYRDALIMEIDTYYKEVIEKYKVTTTVAMKAAKKLTFKKRDFSKYILGFRNHMEDAQEFKSINVELPEDDNEARSLASLLEKSVESFCRLCNNSIRFYEITDKKQYRDSGINADDYKLAFSVMQDALVGAVQDLDALDKEYRKYAPEKFADN